MVMARLILNDESKDNLPLKGEAKMISIYYNAALDEDAIEKAGHAIPFASLMDHCENTAMSKDRTHILGESKFGLGDFFGIGSSPDNKKDSNHCIAQIGQSGFGLPDYDHYFDKDKAEKHKEYEKHVANMLVLLEPATYMSDDDEGVAAQVALTIYNIILQTSQSHMTKTESRDSLVTYNKMSMLELTEYGGKTGLLKNC